MKFYNKKKTRPVGAKTLHMNGRTDRHDTANSRFSQFFWRAWNGWQI